MATPREIAASERDWSPVLGRIDLYLRLHASTEPATEAFVSGDDDEAVPLTYGDALQNMERLAAFLLERGVRKEDVVGVFGNSRAECFLASLATASIGAIYLGLNPKHTARELLEQVEDSKPVLILDCSAGVSHRLVDRVGGATTTPPIWPLPVAPSDQWPGEHPSMANALKAARASVTPDDPAAIVYTSGSTGAPKGALLSHRGLIDSARLTDYYWFRERIPRTVIDWPINHVGWLVCVCLPALIAGGTLVFRERFDAGETLRLIERHGLNTLCVFPPQVMMILEDQTFGTCDLSSLVQVALATGMSAEPVRRFVARTHAKLVNGYGISEASGGVVTITDRDDDVARVATTVGRPVPEVETRLVDASGNAVPTGEPGELLIRGDCLFVGYLNRPEATAEALDNEGWLHTGDLLCEDPDGSLRIVGRVKEMFKSGGYNVYPTEIELVLSEHPAVAEIAVVPTQNSRWGEVGVAFVVAEVASNVAEAELREMAIEKLANYKIPKRFVFRDELPRLPNGKVDRVALRDEAR